MAKLNKSVVYLSVIFFLLFGDFIKAQTLKRAAFLGARLMDLSVAEPKPDTDHGLYLSEILPKGSLGNMQVPKGTVLQQINDRPVRSMSDLYPSLAGIKEGDDLTVIVFEEGARKTYEGVAVGKPKEEKPYAEIEYGEVQYEGNLLRSILYLPKGIQQAPVVFFLQGYTCQSIEMRDNNPAKQLINDWIQKGYAVYLVEKPGMGDSESKVPCMDIDFKEELFAFSKAYEDLHKKTSIDTDRIFLFGHSMGGVIAPLLAKQHPPAGVMVFGIVGNNWYDYMVDIYTEQPLLFGTTEEQVQEDSKYYLPFIKDMLVHKKTNNELLENSLYGDRLETDGVATNLEQGYFIHRHYRYWQTLADVNIPKTWSQIKAPVLVLHGEYDIQAIHPKYGEMIAKNVNKHGGKASFKLLPKTEHVFLKFESRAAQLNVLNNGTYSSTFTTHYNSEVAIQSLEWMQKQSKS